MRIVISSYNISIGDRVKFNKNQPGGEHVKLYDGESFVYIVNGSQGTILDKLHGDNVIIRFDNSGWMCEVSKEFLTPIKVH